MKCLSIFLFILILSGYMNPAATGPSFSELKKPEKISRSYTFIAQWQTMAGRYVLKFY
jgi:hypothetical protein